jgi:oxygen-independent coproporphyrinogen III oxidase
VPAIPPTDALGLYLSVPFCRAKCSFCNFASGVSTPDRIARYVHQLCSEIESAPRTAHNLRAHLPPLVDTVYFGGGTPSLLEPAQLRAIFASLHRTFTIAPSAEITLEAAPGQISPALLDEALRLGVNRISLGVQSFVDRESTAVGRSHTRESCLAEISRLHAAGVPEIAADLIAGLPYQTRDSFGTSLEAAIDSELTHLSVYLFEIDEDSRLGREVLNGGARLHAPAVANEELAASLYEDACTFLAPHNFAQYEISNFARRAPHNAHQSRHNLKYWTRAPYLGFGLDAHSMLHRAGRTALRFANPGDLAAYDPAAPHVTGTTDVSLHDAFEESIFLGLRLNDGLDIAALHPHFPHTWIDGVTTRAQQLAQAGLLTLDPARWRLTLRGRLVSNEVFSELLASPTSQAQTIAA